MGTKKSFVKGLAAGAVLGAVAAMLHAMKDKDAKAVQLEKAAMKIKDKVKTHAKRLGALTRAAYGQIVDTTMAEYRGVKALSGDELAVLAKELKASWKDVQAAVAKKPAASSSSSSKKRA